MQYPSRHVLLWNSLPASVRNIYDFLVFKQTINYWDLFILEGFRLLLLDWLLFKLLISSILKYISLQLLGVVLVVRCIWSYSDANLHPISNKFIFLILLFFMNSQASSLSLAGENMISAGDLAKRCSWLNTLVICSLLCERCRLSKDWTPKIRIEAFSLGCTRSCVELFTRTIVSQMDCYSRRLYRCILVMRD